MGGSSFHSEQTRFVTSPSNSRLRSPTSPAWKVNWTRIRLDGMKEPSDRILMSDNGTISLVSTSERPEDKTSDANNAAMQDYKIMCSMKLPGTHPFDAICTDENHHDSALIILINSESWACCCLALLWAKLFSTGTYN